MRKCNVCGKENLLAGYCIDAGLEYYCSDGCLNKVYTEEEWERICENTDSYWTEWEN